MVEALEGERALAVLATGGEKDRAAPLDRKAAEALVRDGTVPVAIVLPAGIGQAFGSVGAAGAKVQLLADVSDPIAPQMVGGLLQKVVMTAAPDLMMQGGMAQFEKYAGALTPEQRRAVDEWLPRLKRETQPQPPGSQETEPAGPMGVGVEVVDVMKPAGQEKNSVIAFYAAGIGVMFLLFSCAGAGGALLEEVESGTLERILSSRVGMTGLLAAKWLFLTMMGILQLAIMFSWAALAFGLDLFAHVPGFLLMTVFTAAAAASFGLVLATASRSRAQLSGLATIVILTMSALGGSMFPRFLMSETMQRVGLVTFNAWALDGYLKVFWRSAPLWQLWPQLVALSGLTVVFLATARRFARRWETA